MWVMMGRTAHAITKTASALIQLEPQRPANGDATIVSVAHSTNWLVRILVWPSHAAAFLSNGGTVGTVCISTAMDVGFSFVMRCGATCFRARTPMGRTRFHHLRA